MIYIIYVGINTIFYTFIPQKRQHGAARGKVPSKNSHKGSRDRETHEEKERDCWTVVFSSTYIYYMV